MNSKYTRRKKFERKIAVIILAIMIASSSSFTVTAAENDLERSLVYEQEEQSEQTNLDPGENVENDDIKPEEGEEEDTEEVSEEEDKISGNEIEETDDLEIDDPDTEGVSVSDDPYIEYSMQTEVDGYKIKLEAFDGVFPEGEEISLSAVQIEDQEILDTIDSKLSDFCEGDFKQISFDIKVLNAVGEELQPDRSKYLDNEDIIPIQLSIDFPNNEIEGEVEVFHFSDDLSSIECLVSTVDGDEVTVEPEHFSVFTILASENGSYYDGLTPPTGYRTYIEWMPNSTADLRRLQKIYVYAKSGEQISFGSSSFVNLSQTEVTQSLKDSFGYGVGTATSSASIAVTLPYDADAMQEKAGVSYHIYTGSTNPATVIGQIENSTSYSDTNIYLFKKAQVDISNDSQAHEQGTIYNWQQEALGAKNDDNPGGYEPLSFTAPVTGVYTFRFFGTQYTKVETATKVKKTDTFLQKSKNYVGAWDITVTENAAATTPIKGRTYTDALIWTIGANITGNEAILDESVYALTSDGFEYKVDFNGLDPFGFVFFTNKRGFLVSSDDHEDGHFRSLARSVRSKRNQLDDLLEMGVHLNSTPTTEKDESYFITFEKADSDLLQHYTKHSSLADNSVIGTNPAAYTGFKFKGLNSEDHKGKEGYGGYFTFTYSKSSEDSTKILPSTYEIILDFTGNTALESEYGYLPGAHNEVILSNTLVDGENKIYWNGKDEHGNVVIGGEYKVASFNVKAGEVHFPLLDVENNRFGIKVEMQNDISGIDKSKIYYDNSDSDVYGKNIGDKKEYLTGASSAPGAMAFSSNAGDCCAIDVWADYRVATPVNLSEYTITISDFSNIDAFFEAKTTWQYYYTAMDGKRHFDASATLPDTTEVVLQYRIVDKDTAGIGGVDTSDPNWKDSDTGAGKAWQNYVGEVKVSLQKTDSEVNEKVITLDPESTSIFGNASDIGTYKSVNIKSYRFDDNTDPITKGIYPKETSDGLCVFSMLPLHPDDPSNPGNPDLNRIYQYRVVDISNISPDFAYTVDDLFDRAAAVDIPVGAGHITKDIYLEETYEYRYRGATTFNLEFDQLWNDSSMTEEWLNAHRPKAVQVAILYGIPLYEDVDTSTEYDITTEKGYYGEDIQVVWRKIQQIDYLTLTEDGVYCTDSNGDTRKLQDVSSTDAPYAAYFPVWKYMSNGDPYYYKIRPVSYSVDGIVFSEIEYWDVGHIVPKTSLPEFYGVDDDEDDEVRKKYQVVFYDEDVATAADLYPIAVKFTDIPENAEIEITKKDTSNLPIVGKTTTYEIKNKAGKNLMFTLAGEGKYTYEGIEGTAGLSAGATKEIKTSTLDSIVHACGLPLHEYTIFEVEAPEGYQLSTAAIDVIQPDFLSNGSMVGGIKQYLCKKSQNDSALPEPDPDPDPKRKPDSDSTNGPSLESGDHTESDIYWQQNVANNSITGKKLPKTGGLVGSLAAVLLGIFMIGFGIYLTKPSKKQWNDRD